MKLTSLHCLAVACSALALFAIQSAAGAAEPTPAAAAISDVRLADGLLRGQVVNAASAPSAQAAVTITSGNRVVARVVTDERGRFQAPVTRGGVFLVSAAGDERVVRTWTAQAAPPAARDGVLLVSEGAAVRGQTGAWTVRNLAPIGLVGGAAAAIVVVATDDDEHSTGS